MDHVKLINTIMERKGWTQRNLASALGVQQTTISRWLSKPDCRINRARIGQLNELLQGASKEAGLSTDQLIKELSDRGYQVVIIYKGN